LKLINRSKGGGKQDVDGIGFGLTLANISIELCGGKMDISSQKGKSITFKMAIPSQSALLCPS
jgi:sensor histidine kinase regulating citrate/malate metabolism